MNGEKSIVKVLFILVEISITVPSEVLKNKK